VFAEMANFHRVQLGENLPDLQADLNSRAQLSFCVERARFQSRRRY
jgi:hypothetical protein